MWYRPAMYGYQTGMMMRWDLSLFTWTVGPFQHGWIWRIYSDPGSHVTVGNLHAEQVCAHACHISLPLMTAKTHDKHCQHKRHETKDALNTLQTIKKTRLAWHEQSALRVREAKGTRHGRQASPVTYPVIKLYLSLGTHYSSHIEVLRVSASKFTCSPST